MLRYREKICVAISVIPCAFVMKPRLSQCQWEQEIIIGRYITTEVLVWHCDRFVWD